MEQTISKTLKPGESHLPWLFDVKANVRATEVVEMGPAICIRERDGWGKVDIVLTSESQPALMLAYMTLHQG